MSYVIDWGIVVEYEGARHAFANLLIAGMMLFRRNGEQEWLGQIDEHVVQLHLVVKVALQFRLRSAVGASVSAGR